MTYVLNNNVVSVNLYMNELLEKPSPPADDDCCGGGACAPCVWDPYYAELDKWRLQQVQLKEVQ